MDQNVDSLWDLLIITCSEKHEPFYLMIILIMLYEECLPLDSRQEAHWGMGQNVCSLQNLFDHHMLQKECSYWSKGHIDRSLGRMVTLRI